MAQVRTHVDDKHGHRWELVSDDNRVIAVAPSWYATEAEMTAALDQAKRQLRDAKVVASA
jgi:hypothetical protein